MAELEIPKSDREGLAIWREMPEESLSAFLLGMERSTTVSSIPGISTDDTKQAIDTLNTLYTIRAFNEVATGTFIGDLCEALIESDDLESTKEDKLRERLERLLEIEALKIAAKAATLHFEHERLLCTSRVLTDARPVYGANASDAPAAMIITHELKLTYHEGPRGKTQELYFGLGAKELGQLQEQLKRAEEKAKSLREALRPSQIRFIDPQHNR